MVRVRRLLLLALLAGAGTTVVHSAVVHNAAHAQREHRVRNGDSMYKIAKRYGVDVWDLALANDLEPKSRIRPGQQLTVPPKGIVYVRPGQSLVTIAKDHDTTVDDLRKRNRLKPGATLKAGSPLMLPGYERPEPRATKSKKGSSAASAQPGVVVIARHGEREKLRLVDEEGRVSTEAVEQVGVLMRRHAEEGDATRKPDPRLLAVLAAVSDHFEGRDITLVSGLREVRGYTQETSRHVAGRAADIRVAGVSNRALWDFCRSLANTGCGYYPRSSFVHIDVRDSVMQWVDWSKPGKKPRYGTLQRPYRKRELHSQSRPRVGRQVTRPNLVPVTVELVNISARVPSPTTASTPAPLAGSAAAAKSPRLPDS